MQNDLVVNMVNTVWASPYHIASSDVATTLQASKQRKSEEDSWCGYQKYSTKCKHKHGLLNAVVKLLKPINEELSNLDLLAKCLHGKTQNLNACLSK